MFTRKALDCRKPSRSRSIDRRTSCTGNDADMKIPSTTRSLIQRLDLVSFDAVRCERMTTTIIEYCGRYSHQKLARPPAINQPDPFTEKECLKAARGQVTTGLGEELMVTRNQPLYINYLQHGTASWEEDNVYCQGATLPINGELHKEVLVYKSSQILITDVQLEFEAKQNELVDVTNRQELGYLCRPGVACRSGNAQYVYLKRPDLCVWRLIRTLEMEPINVAGSKHYVNRQHRLYLKEGDVEASPTGCPTLNVRRTQYKNMLMTDEDPSSLRNVEGNIIYDLEIRTAVEFSEFEITETAQRIVRANTQRLCTIALSNTALAEVRSPFSNDAIIRVRGDLLYELICTPVIVRFKLHEELSPTCFREAVIGRVGDEIVLLDTRNFVIHEVTDLAVTPCDDHFPEIIKSEEGKFISVHPVTRVEGIQAVTVQTVAGSQPVFSHEDNGLDLLYTDAEIIKYNNLLHFSRIHKLVAAKLTTNLCAHKCGMNIGREGPILDMSNVLPVGLPDLQTLLWDHLLDAGSVCGLLLFGLALIQSIMRGFKFIKSWLSCCKQTTPSNTTVEIHNEPAAVVHPPSLLEMREMGTQRLPVSYQESPPVVNQGPLPITMVPDPGIASQPRTEPRTVRRVQFADTN